MPRPQYPSSIGRVASNQPPRFAALMARTLLFLAALFTATIAGPLLAQGAPSAVSGSWYDPERSGEGFVVQIIAPDQALVVWFTYDEQGRQRWLIGQGPFDGEQVIIDELLITAGGRFGAAFDPDAVTRTPVGSLRLSFSSCLAGSAEYSVGEVSGSLNLLRLSIPSDIPCTAPTVQAADLRSGESAGLAHIFHESSTASAVEPLWRDLLPTIDSMYCSSTPSSISSARTAPQQLSDALATNTHETCGLSGYSGTWFDVFRSGEGFLIEVLDADRVLVYWFSYTPSGEQLWLMGIGQRQALHWQVDRVFSARGGIFGPDFDPDLVELVDWGSAQLALDCASGMWLYSGPELGYGSGEQVLTRLAQIDGLACQSTPPQQVAQEQPLAFTNARLRNFDESDGDYLHAVLVEQGRIVAVGAAVSTPIPLAALRIDLQGAYLMPGLTDLHTHIGTSPTELLGQRAPGVSQLVEEAATGELLVYLSQGVTTVLNAGDFGEPLPRWSREIDRGERIGPKLYSAKYTRGPPGTPDGGPEFSFATQATARAHVSRADTAGYDMIKIYNYTPANALPLIFDEAGSRQMAVIGHFPQTEDGESTLDRGLAAVAHGQAYFWRWGYSAIGSSRAQTASLRNGTSIIATLAHMEIIADIWGFNPAGVQAYRARPELRYLHPTSRALNERGMIGERWNPPGAAPGGLNNSNDYIASYLRRFHQAGIPILLGTDSPTVLGVPGFSAHEEMQVMRVRLQLDDRDVLAMATVRGGEFINRWITESEPFGRIAVGQRADLIALNEDPSIDLDRVRDRIGVMAQGRWYADDWLGEQIELLADRYANSTQDYASAVLKRHPHAGAGHVCMHLHSSWLDPDKDRAPAAVSDD